MALNYIELRTQLLGADLDTIMPPRPKAAHRRNGLPVWARLILRATQ